MRKLVIFIFLVNLFHLSLQQDIVLTQGVNFQSLSNKLQFMVRDYTSPNGFMVSYWIKTNFLATMPGPTPSIFMRLTDSGSINIQASLTFVSSTTWTHTVNGASRSLPVSTITNDLTTCYYKDVKWSLVVIIFSIANGQAYIHYYQGMNHYTGPTISIAGYSFNNLRIEISVGTPDFRPYLRVYIALLDLFSPTSFALDSNFITTYQSAFILFIYGGVLAVYEPTFFPFESTAQDLFSKAPSAIIKTNSNDNWNATRRIFPNQKSKMLFDTETRLMYFDQSLFYLSPVSNTYAFTLIFQIIAELLFINNVNKNISPSYSTVNYILYRRKTSSGTTQFSCELAVALSGVSSTFSIKVPSVSTQTYLFTNQPLTGLNSRTTYLTFKMFNILVVNVPITSNDLQIMTDSPMNLMTQSYAGWTFKETDVHFMGSTASFADPFVSLDVISAIFTGDSNVSFDGSSNYYFDQITGPLFFYYPSSISKTLVSNNNFKTINSNPLSSFLNGPYSFCANLRFCDLCFSGNCYRCWFNYYWNGVSCSLCQIESGYVYDYLSQTCFAASQQFTSFQASQSVFDYLNFDNILVFSIACISTRSYAPIPPEIYYFHGNNLTFSLYNVFSTNETISALKASQEIFRIKNWYINYFQANTLFYYNGTNCNFNFVNVSTISYSEIYSSVAYNEFYIPSSYSLLLSNSRYSPTTASIKECMIGQTYSLVTQSCNQQPIQTTQNKFSFISPQISSNVTSAANNQTNATNNQTANTSSNGTTLLNISINQTISDYVKPINLLVDLIIANNYTGASDSVEDIRLLFPSTLICGFTYFLGMDHCLKCLQGCLICRNPLTCDICNQNYELNTKTGFCTLIQTVFLPNPTTFGTDGCLYCSQSWDSPLDNCQNCSIFCSCSYKKISSDGKYYFVCPNISFDINRFVIPLNNAFYLSETGSSSSFIINFNQNNTIPIFRIDKNIVILTNKCLVPTSIFTLKEQSKSSSTIQASREQAITVNTILVTTKAIISLSVLLSTYLAPLLAVNKFFKFMQLTNVDGGTYFRYISSNLYASQGTPFKSFVSNDKMNEWLTYVVKKNIDYIFNDMDLYTFCLVAIFAQFLTYIFKELKRVTRFSNRGLFFDNIYKFVCKFRINYCISNGTSMVLYFIPIGKLLQMYGYFSIILVVLIFFIFGYMNAVWAHSKSLQYVYRRDTKRFIYLRQLKATSLTDQDIRSYFVNTISGFFFSIKCLVMFLFSKYSSAPFYCCLFLQVCELCFYFIVLWDRFNILLWFKTHNFFWEAGFNVLMLFQSLGYFLPDLLLNIFYVGGNASQALESLFRFIFLFYHNREYDRRQTRIKPVSRNKFQYAARSNKLRLNKSIENLTLFNK